MYQLLVCSVDELWLKGRNRPLYVRGLLKHLNKILKMYHKEPIFFRNDSQRLTFSSETSFAHETLMAMLKVPGLAGISPAIEMELDFDALKKLVQKEMESELQKYAEEKVTFKVVTKRINRKFPMGSMEIERELGAHLLQSFSKLKVDVHKPQIKVDVRILEKRILVSLRYHKGIGGLPIGLSGHGITMLSGGFDSPVASFLMAKRGMHQTLVFFHAAPFVGDEVVKKIKKLSSLLAGYFRDVHLYVIPFGNVQRKISEVCKEEYRTILFRKEMVKIAELLASKINGDAIITGDSLGQVSSQTIYNMSLLDKACDIPILRPLIGLNKLEIIRIAEEIGTHDISLLPHDDACALFAPENPIINPEVSYWNSINEKIDLMDIRGAALKNAAVFHVNPKGELFAQENRLF